MPNSETFNSSSNSITKAMVASLGGEETHHDDAETKIQSGAPGGGWKQRIIEDLMEVLKTHVLFGIFLAKDDKNFTRWERFWNLLGFIGTQIFVISIIGSTDVVSAAICACLRDDDESGSDDTTSTTLCHTVGNTTFSLPADGSLRLEWDPYVKTWSESIDQAYGSCSPDAQQEVNVCSPTKFCCYAHVGTLLGENLKDKWHGMSPADPCPPENYWFLNAMASSLYGVLLSYIFLNPLVAYLLARESTNYNPCAYILIAIQVLWGLVTLGVYTYTSRQLEITKAAYITVMTNIVISLFITSVLVGLVLQSVVFPALARCSCFGGGGGAEEEDEEKAVGEDMAPSERKLSVVDASREDATEENLKDGKNQAKEQKQYDRDIEV